MARLLGRVPLDVVAGERVDYNDSKSPKRGFAAGQGMGDS
jgi:hypothetical protein